MATRNNIQQQGRQQQQQALPDSELSSGVRGTGRGRVVLKFLETRTGRVILGRPSEVWLSSFFDNSMLTRIGSASLSSTGKSCDRVYSLL